MKLHKETVSKYKNNFLDFKQKTAYIECLENQQTSLL